MSWGVCGRLQAVECALLFPRLVQRGAAARFSDAGSAAGLRYDQLVSIHATSQLRLFFFYCFCKSHDQTGVSANQQVRLQRFLLAGSVRRL